MAKVVWRRLGVLSTHSTFFAVLLLLVIFAASGDARPKRSHPTDKQTLPECSEESFCGYVQLNSMGISVQQSCQCRGDVVCPLLWDPFDGRTIMHGNDQYKYCESAPQLSPCGKEDIAYSTYMEMSMITMETLVNSNHLHCQCPSDHLLARNGSKFAGTEDGLSLITTTYKCSLPPRCERTDTCMAITESAHSSFVTRKCSCPRGKFCPNDIRLAAERIDLNRGAYFLMQCK